MEDENSLNNIKNNNNIQNYQENVNKASYISLLEKLNFQRDQAITNYSNLKIEYNNLKSKYEKSEAKLNALEADLRNTNSKFSFSEQKLHENIQNLFTTEKKLSEATNQKDFLKRNNDLLENQLSHCKSIYLDYKSRSEKELNILREDLDEIKNEKEEINKLNLALKSDLNKYIYKCKLITQENETLKSDNDHLIKILEETNKIVKTSEVKTLSLDNTINEYKKQITDLNLEINKLKLENKLQKEYNIKFKDFFSEKISICDQTFESALNEIRKNLQKRVEDRISEYNNLKAEFLNTKIERDKYYGEYSILNEDYQESKKSFQKKYLDIQKEKNNKESEMTKENGFLNEKIQRLLSENNNLKSKITKLESKNNELEQEKKVREKLEMKNKEINEEVGKIKQEKEDLEKENEELKNKINELLSEK